MNRKTVSGWAGGILLTVVVILFCTGATGRDGGETEAGLTEITVEANREVVAENLLKVTDLGDGEFCVVYPEYTEEAVANGHFTGGTDLRMVLLGFRDRLDRGDCGVDIRLNKEADFVLWQNPENGETHAVMESADGQQYAIVTVGDAGIERFPSLRQVQGFCLVSGDELGSFTENWTACGTSGGAGGNAGQPGSEENGSGDIEGQPGGSVIKASGGEILFYNAGDKDSIISLGEEDRTLVESVFGSVSFTEDIAAEGNLPYVVRTEDCKYMFDWSGAGIRDVFDDGTRLQGFVLSQDDLELLKELCVRNGVSGE